MEKQYIENFVRLSFLQWKYLFNSPCEPVLSLMYQNINHENSSQFAVRQIYAWLSDLRTFITDMTDDCPGCGGSSARCDKNKMAALRRKCESLVHTCTSHLRQAAAENLGTHYCQSWPGSWLYVCQHNWQIPVKQI
jgi:hypothetical protein